MFRGGGGGLALLVFTCISSAVHGASPPVHPSELKTAFLHVQNQTADAGSHVKQGRRSCPMCVFVKTATAADSHDGRDRLNAVLDTWVKVAPPDTKIYYFTDEPGQQSHLPHSIHEDRRINVPVAVYPNCGQRMRQMLESLNFDNISSQCGWNLIVDDDTYPNIANVIKKTQDLDADTKHYMGAIYNFNDMPFVHGNFTLISRAAVPDVAKAAAACPDSYWEKGWEDVDAAQCFQKQGLFKDMPPELFSNDFLHDNDRNHPPTTLEQGYAAEGRGKNLGCFDFAHKLLPKDMLAYHDEVMKHPCAAGAR